MNGLSNFISTNFGIRDITQNAIEIICTARELTTVRVSYFYTPFMVLIVRFSIGLVNDFARKA